MIDSTQTGRLRAASLRVRPSRLRPSTLALAVAAQLASTTLLAQGFYVDEQSVRHLGNAYNGMAAIDDDPSAVYYNPAAMTSGDNGRLAGNLTVLNNNLDYDGQPVMLSNADGGTPVPVQGDRVEVSDTQPLPTLYLTLPLDDDLVYGIGINAPFNTGNDLGDRSKARYQTIESTIGTITLTNAFSYRVNDQLSLGFGVMTQQATADLVQALSPGLVCLDGGMGSAGCEAMDLTIDGSADFDGRVDMEGDELSVGYNLGLLYRINERQQLGFGYRSKIDHKLDGDVTVTMPVTFDQVSGSMTTRITTPAIANVSYQHRFDRLTLLLDASWTDWSEFDALKFRAEDPNVQALLADQTFDWDDSVRVGIAAEYALSPSLTLRGGVALDQSPIPDQHATVDLGQDDYHQFAVGLSYQPSTDLVIDAGYMLGLTSSRDIRQGDITDPNQNLAQLEGETHYTFHSLGLGARWSF